MRRCLICRTAIAGRPENPFAPFCSRRCKLIDLGKWLGEEYRVPAGPPQEGDEQERAEVAGEDGDPERQVH